MKTKKLLKVLTAVLALLLLVTAVLIVYNRKDNSVAPDVPAVKDDPAGQTAPSAIPADVPAASPETEVGTGMKDGERFETVIMLEGMDQTVKYEHARNDAIGFEMDYDYELFVRQSSSDCERFVSIYDLADDPENYLEVKYDPRDAETVADALGAVLSNDYDIIREPFPLECAGGCIRIDASNAKGNGGTPDLLEALYIIPAPDGCRVAAAHYGFESAEGFGRRFSYFMNSFSVLESKGEKTISAEQAVSAVKKYCYCRNAELEAIVKAGEYTVGWELVSSDEHEIVVLYRSYTGAQIRYYIDPVSGETYVTESVPAVLPGERRTDEVLNIWDYTV